MPLSATEARTQLGFSSGMNDTQTATATTTAPLVAWRWQLQRFCGSVLSSPIVSAIRRCCRMVTRAPTSTCVICACMAVMSRLRRRNASTTLPRGWARHSANWHQRGRSPAQLSVDVGMGNWSRRRSSSSPGTTVRLYVAVPVTWMQCAMLSSPPSSMLRPPMRTLTTHAAPLAATAGVSSSGRWQRERSQVPIATSWARHWQGRSLDMSRRSMCDSATLICCVAAWKAQHRMLMRACTRKCGRSVRRQASSAFSVSWRQHVRLSAAKADARRLQQSRRQVMDSTRAARLARVVARAHAQEADYAAGAFWAVCIPNAYSVYTTHTHTHTLLSALILWTDFRIFFETVIRHFNVHELCDCT